MTDPFPVAPISAQCLRGYHRGCKRDPGTCACPEMDCDCFDVEVVHAVNEKLADAIIGQQAPASQRPVRLVGMPYVCPEPGCNLEFETERGVSVHVRRSHDVPARTEHGPYGCRALGCDRRFDSAHAEAVHYARVHKSAEEPALPVAEIENPDIDEDEFEADGIVVNGPSQLVLDVAAAVEFLETREWDDIVNEALDEWAAQTVNHDAEVKALVEIRKQRRARGVVG